MDNEMKTAIAKADKANDLVIKLITVGDDSDELRQARRAREAAEAEFEALCAEREVEPIGTEPPEAKSTPANPFDGEPVSRLLGATQELLRLVLPAARGEYVPPDTIRRAKLAAAATPNYEAE